MGIFKKRNEYFYESFVELSKMSLNTYECLVKGIKEFNHENILELKNSVHELEHQADLKKREIEEKLAKEFITPISREDIFLLLDLIDDLTDSIDEISYKIYIRDYKILPSDLDPFIEKGIVAIKGLIDIFMNFKDISNKKVMDPLVNVVLNCEEETDQLYETKVHSLYVNKEKYDYEYVRMSERIYSYFENITDKCRDVVKQIIIVMYKNI